MKSIAATTSPSGRRESLAMLIYLAVVLCFVVFAAVTASDLRDANAALNQSRETLARLDRRGAAVGSSAEPAVDALAFLSGKTITVAGAALQERVQSAVEKAGGAVVSSRIDLQGPRAAEGFVGLDENLEIEQASLQALLYDLEAGTPYLIIESLSIQSPKAFGEAEGARMRVVIGVSGQWREFQ